jgi:signal transduction histidine kinase/DNA-binding response OmpR family regulator
MKLPCFFWGLCILLFVCKSATASRLYVADYDSVSHVNVFDTGVLSLSANQRLDINTPLSLSDTNQVGNILLHELEGWQFSFRPPDTLRKGHYLTEQIPVSIQDFGTLRHYPEWNNYGWFELLLQADSTLDGLPRTLIYRGQPAIKVWLNGRLLLVAGNPSEKPSDEIMSRFVNPPFAPFVLKQGLNHLLVEYSGHTLSPRFTRGQIFSDGLHLSVVPVQEPVQRRDRAFLFGGAIMLLTMLVLIHAFLAYKFRATYHIWVLLTTLFMLIHAFTTLSDTIVDWTFAYLGYYEYASALSLIIAMYFFLIAIRKMYNLSVPWRILTVVLFLSVTAALVAILRQPEWLNILNAILAIFVLGYGLYSLREAKNQSSETVIWIVASGLAITLGGIMVYVFLYIILGWSNHFLFIMAVMLVYTGIPVSLTFNIAYNYASLIGTLERKVLDRTAALTESNEYQKRFFANVSHEFRTPLAISRGIIEKLLRTDECQSDQLRYELSMARRNMTRLEEMTNQIIDLSKIDQLVLTLHRQYFVAEDLIELAVACFRSLAEYKGQTLIYHRTGEKTTLNADKSKVEIIFNNLISNAIKFAPHGGNIRLISVASETDFVLQVMDSGSGVPESERERIFERFYRIKQEEAAYVEGMGIGLELSRNLARLHDGDITVSSQLPQGACFTLMLPCVLSEKVKTIIEQSTPEFQIASDVQRFTNTEPLSAKATILLVEDNRDMQEFVSDVLTEIGNVHIAPNGRQALQMLLNIKPDLIVTDLMMPEMDGRQLVEQLAAHASWREIPVVVLTARAVEEDLLAMLRIGVVDYVTKPFSTEQLLLKTRNLISFYNRKRSLHIEINSDDSLINSLSDKCATYVNTHIREYSLSVEDLAAAVSQSTSSLYRNIQAEMGMTPGDFIREIRLTAARNLVVQNPTIRLNELAAAVGYKSAKTFRKVYEERYGEHPLKRPE